MESPPYGALRKPITSNVSHREKAMRDPRCGTLGETLLTGSRSANERNTSTCYPQYTFRAIRSRAPQPAPCMFRCTRFDTPIQSAPIPWDKLYLFSTLLLEIWNLSFILEAGDKAIRTTMIYAHVVNRVGREVTVPQTAAGCEWFTG